MRHLHKFTETGGVTYGTENCSLTAVLQHDDEVLRIRFLVLVEGEREDGPWDIDLVDFLADLGVSFERLRKECFRNTDAELYDLPHPDDVLEEMQALLSGNNPFERSTWYLSELLSSLGYDKAMKLYQELFERLH